MSDILRNLADLLDQKQDQQDFGLDQNTTQQKLTTSDDELELDPAPVMVPPLQAKLELLKKATGVDNIYDNELDDIKKLTGIRAVVQHVASEDNDITG